MKAIKSVLLHWGINTSWFSTKGNTTTTTDLLTPGDEAEDWFNDQKKEREEYNECQF